MPQNYDIIIIGSGIGGLTAANYLASSGLSVVVFEQHNQIGGYCSSFSRKGFSFDVGVHYLGAANQSGTLGKIIQEFEIGDRLQFNSVDIPYRFFLKDFPVIDILSGTDRRCLEGLIAAFPNEEKNLIKFISFLRKDFYTSLSTLRKESFEILLNSFFENHTLKLCLNALLGNIGTPSSSSSALAGVILFREYILNDSLYPAGGMIALPRVLRNRAQSFGAEIRCAVPVRKVLVSDGKAQGVLLENGCEVFSRVVVSNTDPFQTFNSLNKKYARALDNIQNAEISPAVFMTYLGLKKKPTGKMFESNCSVIVNTKGLDEDFSLYLDGGNNVAMPLMAVSHPTRFDQTSGRQSSSLALLSFSQFKTKEFWCKNREKIRKKMIALLQQFSSFSCDDVEIEFDATPHTFFRYTRNWNGAAYGWAPTIKQVGLNIWPNNSSIENLFFVGHWSTGSLWRGGIPGAAYSGREVSKNVFSIFEKKWPYPLIRL